MKVVVFDEFGQMWDGRSEEFRLRLDAAMAGFDLDRFVAKNLGYVVFQIENGKLRVFLRPSKVHPFSLTAAMYWLNDGPFRHVAAHLFRRDIWDRYVFRDTSAAIGFIAREICRAVDDRSASFARLTASPGDLPVGSPFAELVKLRSELNYRFDPERIWRFLHDGINGRYIVASPDKMSGEMLVRRIGTGFNELARYWCKLVDRAPLRVADMPDYNYGTWVEAAYREVINSQAPLIEKVDCDIHWPREGLMRHRYWRIIAPFLMSDGSQMLLSASVVDRNIRLRANSSVKIH